MDESQTKEAHPDAAATAWPFEGGEMAGRIREHNWAATPLGPIKTWPQALRTAVEMVLASPLVSALVCGPDRVLIYNDAAAQLYGARHPAALGLPLPETFSEGWRDVAPLYERVFAGESVQITAQPLDTRGEGEAASDIFDAVLIPLRDEQGRVAYAHMTGFEVGGRLRAEAALRESEERQRFLLALGDAMRAQSDASRKIEVAARHLGERLNASRILYAEFDESRGVADIFNGWFADGAQSFPAVMRLRDYEGPILDELRAGRTVRIDNVGLRVEEPAFAAIANVGVQALLSVPLVVGSKLVVNLSVHQHEARHWADEEVALVQEVAERLWAEVVRARAEEALRANEERQAFLLKLSDAMRPLVNPIEVQTVALRLLAEHLGLSRAAYSEIQEDHDRARRVATYDGDLPPVPSDVRISDFSAAQVACYLEGRTFVVTDTETDPRVEATRDACRAVQVRAWVGVPLVKHGRLLVVLGVEKATPYAWTDAEVRLLEEAAERTWAASERARAEAALRESEEQQIFLLALSDAIGFLTDPLEIAAVATARLCEHLQVNRVFYGQILGDLLKVEQDYTRGVPSIVGEHSLKPFGSEFIASYQLGAVIRVDDIEHHPRLTDAARAGLRDRQVAAFADVVLFAESTGELSMLAVQSATPRAWSASEESLIRELAERMKSGIKRARAEAVLRESEARHSLLIGSWAQAVWETDAEGVVIADSPSWRAYTGQTLEEWLGYGWLDVIHPDDRAYAERQWREAVAARGLVNAEFRLRTPDGCWRWTNVRAAPVLDAGGRIEKWAGMNIDIDARRQAEEALRESEEQQAFQLQLSDALTPLTDPSDIQEEAARLLAERLDVGWCYFNEFDERGTHATVLRDFHREDLPSMVGVHDLSSERKFLDLVHSGALLDVQDLTGSEQFSARAKAIYGDLGMRSALGAPLLRNGRLAAVLLVADTRVRTWNRGDAELLKGAAERTWTALQRVRAEMAARKSEGRYRTLFESIDEGFCIIEMLFDPRGKPVDYRFLELNPVFEQQAGFGITPGQRIREIAPNHEQFWFDIYGRIALTGEPERFEHGAEAFGVFYDVYAFRVDAPELRRVAVLFRDITERKRVQEQLRQSEERQAFLLRFSDALRAEPNAKAVVARAVRMLGEELRLDRCYATAMYPAEDRAEVIQEFRRPDLPPMPSPLRFSDYPETGKQSLNRTLIYNDTATHPDLSERDRTSLAALDFRALLSSIVRRGAGNPIWSLGAVSSQPRKWSASEVALVEEATERTWAAVERAHADAVLRESEERLSRLVEGVPLAIGLTNAAGEVTIANAAWRAIVPSVIPSRDPERLPLWRAWGPDGGLLDKSEFPGARALRGESVLPGIEMLYDHGPGARWKQVSSVPIWDGNGEVVGTVSAVADIDALKRSEAALRESEARLRDFGEASQDVLWIRDAETLSWTYLTPAFETIYGISREEALAGDNFRNWTDMILQEDRGPAIANIQKVVKGERVTFEYRIRRPSDGQIRWLRNTDFPILDDAGRVASIGGIGTDVTADKETAERMKVMVAELQHRTRNLIAVVRSIAQQTMAMTGPTPAFQEQFSARMEALARVQGLLSRSDAEPVMIEALIRMELDAMGAFREAGDRIALSGPPVPVRHSVVQTLALALHELATNARKYGALSTEHGRLSIMWHVKDADGEGRQLGLEWAESGGAAPIDVNPERRGYGRELIERALPYALGAKTRYELRAEGVHCTINLPLDKRERRRRS